MSLFSDLKPRANWSRNVFDRSRSETFSQKLGTIVPVMFEETIPDGKYKINMSNIVRVSEQTTANFVSLNQNYEFFFVPYSQLWKSFNKFIYKRGERTRSFDVMYDATQTFPTYVPCFDLKALYLDIFNSIVLYRACNAVRAACIADNVDFPEWLLTEAANGHIYAPTAWFEKKHVDVHGRFCGYDQLRVLDMLGYGNVWPLFKFALASWSPSSSITQEQFQSTVASQQSDWWTLIEDSIPDYYTSAFKLMAYVKIFNDIYRNRQYDDYNYAYLFNCDWFAGNTQSAFQTEFVCRMCKPFYRMYKKDLFTGLYPDTQFGDVSVASANMTNPFTLASVNSQGQSATSTVDVGISVNSGVRNLTGLNSGGTTNSVYWSSSQQSSVSALAIRQSLALQKYRESLLRAGNREADLQRAQFGVSSKYIDNDYVEVLGSFASPLQLNPVAATANTTGDNQSNLGELGAYSVGSISAGSGKTIDFEAYDFGVIIGVSYIMPETKYEAFGLDPQNAKVTSDEFYNPYFQNLGLSPVYSGFLNMFGDNNNVLGYLARYYEYKTAISKVHGEFFGSNPIVPYEHAWDDSQYYSRYVNSSFGAFSHYVAPRDIRVMDSGTLQMLYIAPEDADRIFKVSDQPEFAFDHFKTECSFEVKCVLPMSVLGLPL